MNYVSPKMEMIEIENEDVILTSPEEEVKPGTGGGLGGGNEGGFAPASVNNDDNAAVLGLR